MRKQIYVKGISHVIPNKLLEKDVLKELLLTTVGTKEAFEKRYGANCQYFEHINFNSKRVLSNEDSFIGLMIQSANLTLEKSMLKAQDIDVILCAYGGTPMFSGWLYSAIIANELGVNNAMTRDFSGSCASILFAIEYATLLLKKAKAKQILIVAGDNLSNYLTKYNISKSKNIPTYGDGVGSFILSSDEINSVFRLTKLEIMQDVKFASLFVVERFENTSALFEKEINAVKTSDMTSFVDEDSKNAYKIVNKLVGKKNTEQNLIVITGNTGSSRINLINKNYPTFNTYSIFGHVGTADIILNLCEYGIKYKTYPRKTIVVGWGVGYVWGGFSLLKL